MTVRVPTAGANVNNVVMTERYHGYTPTGRAATFNNPARSSMPSSIGYTSLYAGDMHVLPASTRHPITTPRGYSVSTSSSGAPTTTTRTYSVTQDPARRSSIVQDHSRNRRSTVDSTSRPPVIVTTTQKDRPQPTSTHRGPSPVRHSHRASEGQFFTQPASSNRARPNQPTYNPISYETDDYSRSRDRTETLTSRDAEAYRNSRPSVSYPSDPRHSTAAVDYGDDGYQYTNAGELARYDLDHSKPARSRQRESMDRGYYRPNISYNTDQRSLNVNASADLSRNYSMNTSRPYEGGGRGGPPPSTRGFAQVNRSFDSNGPVPPSAPVPPSPTTAARLEPASSEWREGRRSRPVSLYQDVVPHSTHHDDYYRSRDDERNLRELRDRERDRERDRDRDRDREPKQSRELTHFHDDSVQTRGFGIRTGPSEPEHDSRRDREVRREEHRKRSDEDLPPRGSRESDLDRHHSRDDTKDDRRGGRDDRRGSDEDKGRDRSRIRDKLSAGMGIAAAAVGLKPILKQQQQQDTSEPEPRHRRSPSEAAERLASIEARERARTGDQDRSSVDQAKEGRGSPESREAADARARHRNDAQAKLNGEATVSASESDDGPKRLTHEPRSSSIFNPNDASDISKLREQLASADKDMDKEPVREKPAVIETRRNRSRSQTRSRSTSDPRDSRSKIKAEDEPRGRPSISPTEPELKMVRVVSPPREKSDEKPLKGILKNPKPKFPEPTDFVREGAAPHKEDKKAKEVPQGARWTKISRKVVNPEALTIGKERFEVRDDFVIVLRVLGKEEIQAYAAATQVLRGKKRPIESEQSCRC